MKAYEVLNLLRISRPTLTKNLYNHANYLIKQEYRVNGKWLRYQELDKRLKVDMKFPDYKEMPTAQSAQQTLKLLDKNWKSFYASMRDFKKHPEKYLGRPRPPKYLKKDGVYTLVLTNQNCKFDGEMIYFPKVFHGFTLKPMFVKNEKFVTFNQVRLIPHKIQYKARRVYRGLFKANNQTQINADLNGAYQIIKKVFQIKWDRGCALHPVVVNLG
ncbi:MAG: hypothetical protein KH020_04465 [Clostridiales bacterium]|nr:hypothetical protein [Clostridiales bacterium]